MTYIIAEPCIDIKDRSCVDVCPVDCIHEFERMLIIDPEECIDCGACEPECPVEAIFPEDALPEKWEPFVKVNYAYGDGMDVVNQLVVRRGSRSGECTHHRQAAGRQVRESRRHHSTQTAVDAVPQNCIAHRLVHHESDASGLGLRAGPEQLVDHHGTPTGPPSGPDSEAEVVGPTEPVRRG